MTYACIAHGIQNNLYDNFLKSGKRYVKYIIYVCICMCARAYARTHAHAHRHKTQTYTHTHAERFFR
jgi:hypothetical protein